MVLLLKAFFTSKKLLGLLALTDYSASIKTQQYLHCHSTKGSNNKMVGKINQSIAALAQTLQPASANPNKPRYSLASQYNNALNIDRFYTPFRCATLCIAGQLSLSVMCKN